MYKEVTKKANFSLMALSVVLVLSVPTFGVMTAYNNYDYATSPWTSTLDPNLSYQELTTGTGEIGYCPTGNGYGYPAGNSAFGGAVELTPPSCVMYNAESLMSWNDTHNYAEGTIEAWVAPHWNGENQGGDNPDATYQYIFDLSGVFPWRPPLQLFFMDNAWAPEPGFQVMAYWDDGTQSQGFEGYSFGGSCYDWTTGSWHHIAFSWDADWLGLYVDGNIVIEHARTNINPDMFDANGAYLLGYNTASGPANCFDGWVDELAISSHAKYTPGNGGNTGGGTYTVPTTPIIPPQTPQEVWDLGFGMENDLYKDCYINFLDFAILANNNWDFVDLATFVNDWLRSNHPDDPYGEKPWNPSYCPSDPCNILENPSFEYSSDTATAFWGYDEQIGSQYDFYTSGNAHTGNKCLAITGIIAGQGRWFSHNVYFVKGASYRFSCWVKSEGTGIDGRIQIPNADVNYTFAATPVWTCIEKHFIAPYTDMDPIYLMSYGLGTVFFDDVSIEMTSMPVQINHQTIPTNAEPLTEVIIPDSPTVADQYAAIEVQRVLKEMTGIELDIIPQTYSVLDTGGIYINCAPDISEYSADLAAIGDEGIILDINDNIVCLGNTKRGIYYSTQELLYQLGCRWYTPWDGGECIPNAPTLTLNYQKIVHNPSFTLRGNHTAWSYHYPPTMDMLSHPGGFLDWAARNRMNALKGHYVTDWGYSSYRGHSAQDYAGHTIHRIVDPSVYFATHPEYFPLIDGVRTDTTPWNGRAANVCVSNSDVIQICADFVIDYFNTHPYADRVHIGQMDVGGHCECSSCVALDPPGSVDWPNKTNGILVFTDRWLWFINRIADIVKLSYPDKFVGTYSYAETHTLPIDSANDPCDNVMIEYCWAETNFQSEWDIVRCHKHDMNDPTCPNNVEGMQILNDWVAVAPISVYSYYLYYSNPGTAGSYLHHDASFYKALHDAGVRRVNDEVGTDMLSAPLLLNLRARLLWDIDTDVNQYIDDFCNNVYGLAAVPVKQFFTALEETVSQSTKTHVFFNDFDLFTPAIITELNGYLDTADTLASGDTTLLARIARLRIAMIYTEIKTLTDPVAIDALQAQAYTLVQTYDIPIRAGVWDVLAP